MVTGTWSDKAAVEVKFLCLIAFKAVPLCKYSGWY